MTPTTPTHAQSFKLGVGCRPHRGQVSEAGGKGPRRAGVPRAHPVRPGRQWRPVLALQSPRSAPGGNGEKQAARGALSMGTAQDGRDLRVSCPFFHVTHIPPAHSLQHRGSPAPRMTRWLASSTAVSASAQPWRPAGARVPGNSASAASLRLSQSVPAPQKPPLCPSPAPPPAPARRQRCSSLGERGLSWGIPAAVGLPPGPRGPRPPCWGDTPGGWEGPGRCPAAQSRSDPRPSPQVWTRFFRWKVLVTDFPGPQKIKRQRRR